MEPSHLLLFLEGASLDPFLCFLVVVELFLLLDLSLRRYFLLDLSCLELFFLDFFTDESLRLSDFFLSLLDFLVEKVNYRWKGWPVSESTKNCQ